jgi:protein-S-isoprenylcysteine O-methyltransferase Ste14
VLPIIVKGVGVYNRATFWFSEELMVEILRWVSLGTWVVWLVVYWGAGIGLVSNFLRALRSSRFSYDRFFIFGLVVLSNIILWTGYLILRGRIGDPLAAGDSLVISIGSAMLVVGASGTFWCRRQMRESWTAHTTLVENHRLIDHGPYHVIRHPIYAFSCLMTAGTVLVFPTWWNIPAGLGMILLYIFKLQVEERMLVQYLPGYREYRGRVPYRIIPRIW